MELSKGIRKIGFRRWYERQLIESHLYFVSSFLCLIAVMAGLYAAERSVCGRCSAYGGLELSSVMAGAVPEDAPQEAGESVAVRCAKCGHQWTLV